MKFLLDIPLFMSTANWVWVEDETVSPTFCVENAPLMNSDCWSRLIVKALGIAIILGACLNKAPVMLNLWNTKSTAGLSSMAVYSETLVYANAASYGMLSGHPFTAYGENLALFLQSLVITYLMWSFAAPPVSSLEQGVVNFVVAAYIVVVTNSRNVSL
jgi:hypothetical protein